MSLAKETVNERVRVDEFLTTSELAQQFPYWRQKFWSNLRVRGGGPRFYSVGRRVLYRAADVVDWIEAHGGSSTAQVGSKYQRDANAR